MPTEQYTLKVRRFKPDEGEGPSGPYWQEFDVELDPTLSVLDGLLQAKDRDDGSLAVRCSCRAAICGSCGVRINGKSALACNTRIGDAAERARMTRLALRISSSSAARVALPRHAACVLDLLGQSRPRAHAAVESLI